MLTVNAIILRLSENGNITQLKNNLHLALIAIFDILAHLTRAQQLLGWKNVA